MTHAEHQVVFDWLAEHGATVDSPAVLRDKVRAARVEAAGLTATRTCHGVVRTGADTMPP